MINAISNKVIYLGLIALSIVILVPYTGNCHLFDWDEINFAECAREMIVSKNYHTVQLNYQPFWEKPPLFIWLQVVSMKIFGINEFAARFPNILNGIITICLLFYFGNKLYDKRFGLLWSIIHLGTLLPHLYFRSGIIDPWFNLFGFISFYCMVELIIKPHFFKAILGGICLGLAVLTKGPAMVLILAVSIVPIFFLKKENPFKKLKYWAAFKLAFFISGGSWFIIAYLSGNGDVIKAFIDYQIRLLSTEDSGHGGFFLYHVIVLLIGCFPASVFAIGTFTKRFQNNLPATAMKILLIAILIIFSIVKTKIVHYSSMAYYPISFLAVTYLINSTSLNKLTRIFLVFLSVIIGFAVSILGLIEQWKSPLIRMLENTDKFAAENLKLQVYWNGYEWLIGVLFIILMVIFLFLIYRKSLLTASVVLFVGNIIWITLLINSFVGKVEQYSQGSAINFFKWASNQNAPVDTYGYKSYAYMFYGNRLPLSAAKEKKLNIYITNMTNAGYDKRSFYNIAYLNWLMEDKSEYPVYIVSKIQDKKNVLLNPQMIKLYDKGGYVFYCKRNK